MFFIGGMNVLCMRCCKFLFVSLSLGSINKRNNIFNGLTSITT